MSNEVTDDYALESVPDHARLPWTSVVVITLGIMGAMVFLQVSGEMALQYGVTNTIIALLYATIVTGLLASLLAYFAAKNGLNCSLITRSSGFGHAGARITALFYAANFIALAAIEGAIMANAIHAYLESVPVEVIMVVLTIVNIGLNWYGIQLLERFQKYSLPVYLVLLVAAIFLALRTDAVTGVVLPTGISGSSILAGAGVLNGIVALQSLLTADYARFSRETSWVKVFIIGFTPQIASFLVMGLVGVWFAVRFNEANPGVYLVLVMGVWGAIYTVLSQLRINVINLYSGSLSLEGFFSYFSPKAGNRVIWVFVSALLALALMLLDVLGHIGSVLTFLGSFMFAWVATLVADLMVVRPRRQSAGHPLEYRAEYLPAFGRTGLPAVIVGSLVGGGCALFADSSTLAAASGFIAGGIAFVLHLVLDFAIGVDPHIPGQSSPEHNAELS